MIYSDLPQILVVDDDERIRTLITRYLWKHHFVVLSASNAEEALEIIGNFDVSLVIADVMMPGLSGFEMTQHLRKEGNHIPIILLTALGEVENRIDGLERGADDYLPKPFDPKELVLRMKSLLRRAPQKKVQKEVHVGSYLFIAQDEILLKGSDSIKLTDLENKLLAALVKVPNEPISREDLAVMCDMSGTERAIDVQVTRLRKKMEDDPTNPRYLKTVRGKGYMIRLV